MHANFFSIHDQFSRTSSVGNWTKRLNARHEAIIGSISERYAGCRVLDIASHDGRWAAAALHAGAAHVTGIEIRPELSAVGRENLASLGYGDDRFEAVTGDIFARREVFSRPFDIVLCLGFLYHTARHIETLDLIRSTRAPLVVIDTRLALGPGSCVEVLTEDVDHPANGKSDNDVRDGKILVSWPSRAALTRMLDHFGYRVFSVDWTDLLQKLGEPPGSGQWPTAENPLVDYARGERGTFVAELR